MNKPNEEEAIKTRIENEAKKLFIKWMKDMPKTTLDDKEVEVVTVKVEADDGKLCLGLETINRFKDNNRTRELHLEV